MHQGTIRSTDYGEPRTRRGPILAIVLVSYLMIVLDISIVITALPKIRETLGFSATGLSWVHTAYTLAFGGLLLAGARAGDLFGRRRMFIAGLALFTAASLLIGLATSPAMLVVARGLQGLGSAVLAPATLALLSVNFPEGPERNRALSWYGATGGIGASIGMVLGGVFADLFSWRFGFFINVPIGIALIWAVMRFVHTAPRQSGRLDIPGAVLSTLGMLALVYGLVEVAEFGWSDVHGWLPLCAGVVLLGAFVKHEGLTEQPLMPLRLFAQRQRMAAYVARLFYLAGMIGFWFYTTQYLQGVLGMRPMQAGLAFLPATVLTFLAAFMVPRLVQRWGTARVLIAGLATSAIGMLWLAQVGPETDYVTGVALPMLLIGIGQGTSLSPLTVAGVAGVAPQDAGAASGVVNAAHQLGGSIGLALLVVIFSAAGGQGGSASADLSQRVAACLGAGAILLAMALLIVLFVGGHASRPRHGLQPAADTMRP